MRRIIRSRMPMIASGALVGMAAELLGWPSGAAILLMLTAQAVAARAQAGHAGSP